MRIAGYACWTRRVTFAAKDARRAIAHPGMRVCTLVRNVERELRGF
jgi:hypothetical protein